MLMRAEIEVLVNKMHDDITRVVIDGLEKVTCKGLFRLDYIIDDWLFKWEKLTAKGNQYILTQLGRVGMNCVGNQ